MKGKHCILTIELKEPAIEYSISKFFLLTIETKGTY